MKKRNGGIWYSTTVDYLIMHSFFEHLFPLHGWPRTLHQKIVTYSRRLPSLIVESQKCMYSLEWHTLGMLHKNMRYEIVNCTIFGMHEQNLTGRQPSLRNPTSNSHPSIDHSPKELINRPTRSRIAPLETVPVFRSPCHTSLHHPRLPTSS